MDSLGIEEKGAPPPQKQFEQDFKANVADLDAVHGKPRNEEEKKQDDSDIKQMDRDDLTPMWRSPWFPCKDLSKYLVKNPAREFPDLSQKYHKVQYVVRANFDHLQLQKAKGRSTPLVLPPHAHPDKCLDGDLTASPARRRKHLTRLISYCWQLNRLMDEHELWKQQQAEKRKVIKPKKKPKKEKKEKKKKKNKRGKKGKDTGLYIIYICVFYI